jgi:MFS family permease
VAAALPAARLSDRTGRKPVVWAAALVASLGVGILALAGSPPVALVGAFFLGVGSGAYLAVDWALMTDIIPLESGGRYMGIANIANSVAGPIGLAFAGPIMDAFYRSGDIPMGPRVAVGLGVLALAAASIILVGVHPRRDPRTS